MRAPIPSYARNPRFAALLLAALAAGCGGRTKVDAELVDWRLDAIETDVPNCETREAAAGGAMRTADPDAAARHAAALREMGSRLRALARGARAATALGVAPPSPYRAAGACGGSIDVTFEHKNGDNDYDVAFSSYCMQSDDGDLVVDGAMKVHEEGKPSDFGPVISELEMESDGPVVVSHDGGSFELTLDGARTRYGYPAAWQPGVPDEENPDVVTVDYASAVFPEREDYIRDVRIERAGDDEVTVRILEGEAGTKGEGYVDVRTAEDDPIVFEMSEFDVTSGTVELLGSGGTVATLQSVPGEMGAVTITLDGVPFDRELDCTAAGEPLFALGFALMSELPIY